MLPEDQHRFSLVTFYVSAILGLVTVVLWAFDALSKTLIGYGAAASIVALVVALIIKTRVPTIQTRLNEPVDQQESRARHLEAIATETSERDRERHQSQKEKDVKEAARQAALDLEREHKKRIRDLADSIWKYAEANWITPQVPFPIVAEEALIELHNNQDIFKEAMGHLEGKKLTRNSSHGRWEFGKKPEKTNLDK